MVDKTVTLKDVLADSHIWSYLEKLKILLPSASMEEQKTLWRDAIKEPPRVYRVHEFMWWPEFTAVFLPYASDEQKDYLWERAIAGLEEDDIDWVYAAHRSMARILEVASDQQKRKYLAGFNFDSLKSPSISSILTSYATSLEGSERREVVERFFEEVVRWFGHYNDEELGNLLKNLDVEVILEKWNEIIVYYQSNNWAGSIYYDPNTGGDGVSGLYTFQWLNAIAHAIPAEYTAIAVRQICDIQYYSAHPYRRAGVIKRLIQSNDSATTILRETYERLLAETEVPDYSARDPFAIAAELVLLLPETSREDEMMARVSYAIRKSLHK